jgi:hypothetical protein
MIQGRTLRSYFTESGSQTGLRFQEDFWSYANPLPGSETRAALQTMEAQTKMRLLIITKNGLLGLAPVTTQVGDAVIIIAGYEKPMIGRSHDQGEAQFGHFVERLTWTVS